MKKITIMNEHLGVGGIEKYVSSLTRMLDSEYEIDLIITYKLKENSTFRISNKTNITYLIEESSNKGDIKRAFKRRRFVLLFKEIFKSIRLGILRKIKTKKAIKNLDTDYLITTRLYETKIVNKLLKNSNIIKIATDHTYPNRKYKNKLIKATRNFNKLVVSSENIKNIYKKQIGDKVEVVNNFIENINSNKNKLNTKNIITVGVLSREKDFTKLIEIMSLIVKKDKDITLTLVGDGPKKNDIQNKIKELGLEKNIELTGFLSQVEIEERMINSSLFAMTSKKESSALTLIEAMNMYLPIIAFSRASGAKELLEDGTGILINKNNKEEYANKIVELLNDKELLEEYSKKSKEKVYDFTFDKAKVEWIKILETEIPLINKKVMFISSTGGHLNELLMLKPLFKKYHFMLITENTKTNKNLKNKYGRRNVKYLVYGTRKHMLTYPFKLIINCFKSLYYYIKFRPKFIITTGAHTAGPMCIIGKIFRSKIIYIETFANSETKTVTGSIVYKFADMFVVQWESMLSLYENATYGGWIY